MGEGGLSLTSSWLYHKSLSDSSAVQAVVVHHVGANGVYVPALEFGREGFFDCRNSKLAGVLGRWITNSLTAGRIGKKLNSLGLQGE